MTTAQMTRPSDITEKEWRYAWRCMMNDGRSVQSVIDDIRALRQLKAAQGHANAMGYN